MAGQPDNMRAAMIQDFPESTPKHGQDVFLLAKQWLADPEYSHVIALVPAQKIGAIRRHFNTQPVGIAVKRAIAPRVVKNIQTYAPRCRKAGDISEDAESFLLTWSSGQTQRVPPPEVHSILSYTPFALTPVHDEAWSPGSRKRHVNVELKGEYDGLDGDDDESDDDPEGHLPIDWQPN